MKTATPALMLALALVAPVSASEGKRLADRGADLIRAGRPREALPHLNEAIRLEPKEPWHYIKRGTAYYDLRESALSLEDMDKAIELDPRIPQAWFNRGNLCHRVGRYKQAVKHYDRAMELSPPDWLVHMIKRARANSVASHDGVLRAKLKAPNEDLAKLAKEAGTRRDPMAFWLKLGKVENLAMSRTESLGEGRERSSFITLRCVRINMPRTKGFDPLPLYLPLQRGDILNDNVAINCQPFVAILSQHKDPFGVIDGHVRLYLEWLFFKSGD